MQMKSKESITTLSEKEADKYFIFKFEELANEKEKMGFVKFAKMCRENIDRIRHNKDLIEFEEISKFTKGEIKNHIGISRRYMGWFEELANEKEKKGDAELASIFHKRAERARACSKFFWVWDKKFNEMIEY
jgi:hypothetical protein